MDGKWELLLPEFLRSVDIGRTINLLLGLKNLGPLESPYNEVFIHTVSSHNLIVSGVYHMWQRSS